MSVGSHCIRLDTPDEILTRKQLALFIRSPQCSAYISTTDLPRLQFLFIFPLCFVTQKISVDVFLYCHLLHGLRRKFPSSQTLAAAFKSGLEVNVYTHVRDFDRHLKFEYQMKRKLLH